MENIMMSATETSADYIVNGKFKHKCLTETTVSRLKEGDRFLIDDTEGNTHEVKVVSTLKGFPARGWVAFRLVSKTYEIKTHEGKQFVKYGAGKEKVLKLKANWYFTQMSEGVVIFELKEEGDDY